MKKTKGLLTSFLYLMLSTHCSTALSYETHARILYTTKLSNIDYNGGLGDYLEISLHTVSC